MALPALLLALVVGACTYITNAHPSELRHHRRAVTPAVADSTVYPSLDMQGLNRDSCVSVGWEHNMPLWVCRDTQKISDGIVGVGVIANTASYSSLPSPPSAPSALILHSPQGFGSLFYPLPAGECTPYGACSGGTRWVGWPNTGPAVTFAAANGTVSGWQVIAQQYLKGLTVESSPGFALYHVASARTNASAIPATKLHTTTFWTAAQVGYGNAASVVHGGYAYMYGETPGKKLAVGRVALTGPQGQVADKGLWEYYVNGTWVGETPSRDDVGVRLKNTRSAQGTMYFSNKWNSFVWIGGDGYPNAKFYVSTAPKPEGPWTEPALFYTGALGIKDTLTYSTVAHPALTDGTGDYIFLSYSRTIKNSAGNKVYDQPLIRVDWK